MGPSRKTRSGYEKKGIFSFPEYPRPDKASDLFASSGKRRDEVMMGGKDNDWDLYCMGYWRAADALVDHITQNRNADLERPYASYWESQAYAALFLYRHYLELRLKEMLLGYAGDFSSIDREHRLLNLWEALVRREQEVLRESPSGEAIADLETAKRIISEFDRMDKDSQAFRYPKDRKGQLTIPPIQFDLVLLKEALGWLSQLLDGWSLGIHEYMHAPRE